MPDTDQTKTKLRNLTTNELLNYVDRSHPEVAELCRRFELAQDGTNEAVDQIKESCRMLQNQAD